MYSLLLYTCEPWIITERKKETEGNRNVVWQKNYEGPFKWQDRQITALVPGACLEERRQTERKIDWKREDRKSSGIG